MTRPLYMFIGVISYGVIFIESDFVRVELFKEFNCEESIVTTNLESLCTSLPSVGYQVSGVVVHEGSCVALHNVQNCKWKPYIIAYPDTELCSLPYEWNDRVFSVRDCDYKEVYIMCPEGSFVREIEYGDKHEAISVHCFKPNEDKPIFSGTTPGNPPRYPFKTGCPIAAHGVSMIHTSGLDMFHAPNLECSRPISLRVPTENKDVSEGFYPFNKPEQVKNDKRENHNSTFRTRNKSEEIRELCNTGDAVTGIYVKVDEGGGIKRAGFYCTEVADPALMCEPHESLSLVLSCDNSVSNSDLKCSYAKTVGVGHAVTMSEAEREQMTFFLDIGFTVKTIIPYLSAKMSAELNMSELVEYQWIQSDTVTWKEETTVTATVLVPPKTHTKLLQLVGKCSFYETSTNFLKSVDANWTYPSTTTTKAASKPTYASRPTFTYDTTTTTSGAEMIFESLIITPFGFCTLVLNSWLQTLRVHSFVFF